MVNITRVDQSAVEGALVRRNEANPFNFNKQDTKFVIKSESCAQILMLRFPFDNNWLETIMGRMLLLLFWRDYEHELQSKHVNVIHRIIVACHIIINKTAT